MISNMPRVNAVLKSEKYQKLLKAIEKAEQDRKFCKHTMEHFLDTARIMYIISMEEKWSLNKEIIYAAALLHDIGRAKEYEKNIPHNQASAQFAKEVLPECGFSDDEIKVIAQGILCHRNSNSGIKSDSNNYDSIMGKLLYKADKLSRMCFNCQAEKECYWHKDKKNSEVIY